MDNNAVVIVQKNISNVLPSSGYKVKRDFKLYFTWNLNKTFLVRDLENKYTSHN